MPPAATEPNGQIVVHVDGDLAVPDARAFYARLRGTLRRRGVKRVVVDLSRAGRIDSAGVAVVSLLTRSARRAGKSIELVSLGEQHRAVFELGQGATAADDAPPPGALERLGAAVIAAGAGARAFGGLIASFIRRGAEVVVRRRRAPSGAFFAQIAMMGADALFIVGLLSFLLGMTTAFQGEVLLQRFGAGPFVADMVSVSMVRELAPLMTAVIVAGRTGAAIAAELATMRMRSEVDALATMGIDPVRFLIVPRLGAITIVGPGLTLFAMFVGIFGGMIVAAATMSMPLVTFWGRVVDEVELGDVMHGLAKGLVFAWIVGLVASHTGLRAKPDATSVGGAATRTVVASIFLIVVVDAIFATVSTLVRGS